MTKWTGRSKGNLLGYKIVIWTLKYLNIHFSYLILRFLSVYYFLFSSAPREALVGFYAQSLNLSRKESSHIIRSNFYELAQSIVDKFAFSAGKKNLYSYSQRGEERLVELANEGNGLILVSGHYGNWDIAGQLLTSLNQKINILMFDNEHEKIKKYLSSQGIQNYQVIPQKNDMGHLIKIYEVLKKGEILCMHADRFVEGAPTIELDFFGQKALFPLGPFQLISKLKSPYAFVFAHKIEKFKYHFTADFPEADRKDAKDVAQSFANILASKVRENPNHWFNYFDFFNPS